MCFISFQTIQIWWALHQSQCKSWMSMIMPPISPQTALSLCVKSTRQARLVISSHFSLFSPCPFLSLPASLCFNLSQSLNARFHYQYCADYFSTSFYSPKLLPFPHALKQFFFPFGINSHSHIYPRHGPVHKHGIAYASLCYVWQRQEWIYLRTDRLRKLLNL